jgi:hypothetical protein
MCNRHIRRGIWTWIFAVWPVLAESPTTAVESSLMKWEQANRIVVTDPIKKQLVLDLENSSKEIRESNPTISTKQIEQSAGPVVRKYLDAVAADAKPRKVDALLKDEIFNGTAAVYYPEPRARGRLIIENPIPMTVYIDGEQMAAGTVFIVAAGERVLRIQKPPAGECARTVVVKEQQVVLVNCAKPPVLNK